MTMTRRTALASGLAMLTAVPARAGISDAPEAWRAPTRYIDTEHPAVATTATRLTASLPDDTAKAQAIFRHVRDTVAFGFGCGFWDVRASDVLAMGKGYCNTKSTLFVALLRAAGIPARQVFVDIHSSVLGGILDPGTAYVDHSYAEVWLDGEWRATDAYIVDTPLFTAGQARTGAEGRLMGYGVHSTGHRTWDGRNPSFSQFNILDPRPIHTRVWGVFGDVGDLYTHAPGALNRLNPILRAGMGAFAAGANQRADSLRRGH